MILLNYSTYLPFHDLSLIFWSKKINLSYTECLLDPMVRQETKAQLQNVNPPCEHHHNSSSPRRRQAVTSGQWLCSPPSQFPCGSLGTFSCSLSSEHVKIKTPPKKQHKQTPSWGRGEISSHFSIIVPKLD